ncbi:methyl-accepting chemotaxis protein [Oceanospirillum multiglobuliferum]|uniref:Methyl-accepting transducer domain-containing protein n=1 Tax=Oceanospirillum multiglobuliferum TaxID=64969 RepID=A0A1T4P4C1_9GAMM|nr:methyl-accepting chemotaxis protein [Oceanospirillum multiglobuliferum]OPX54837.1 hypothetical protein BTE48_12020 [Oceanospirillum multiglobuliferum]SJZ86363.1 methyl-accepting chemotaxis protein [Oceanospirillum multiglobuliferum]
MTTQTSDSHYDETLKETPFKLRLSLGFMVPLATLLILGIIALWGIKEVSAGLETVYKDRVVPLSSLKVISDDYAVLIIDSINKADNGMITAENAYQKIQQAEQRIQGIWAAYLKTELTPEESQLATEAEILFAVADAAVQQASTQLKNLSGITTHQLSELNGPMYLAVDPVSEKINQLVALQLKVAKQEYLKANAHYAEVRNIIIALLSTAFLGSLAAGIYIITCVSRQLGEEPERVRVLTSRVAKGDLTIPTDHNSHPDSIMVAVSAMAKDLEQVVQNVKNSTQEIATLGTQLHQRTEATRQLLQIQSDETQQISSAMTEMNATVHEVASSATMAAQASHKVEHEMEKGLVVIEKSINSVHHLAAEVNQSALVISKLAEDSEQVETILSVIGGIAEQTNLLALNAAIEAARAGEQGRGFAVVADEVRTLASRTHQSTEQIHTMICRIQEGVASAVKVMRNNEAVAKQSVLLTESTRQSLYEINLSVKTVNDMNTQIASAAEEQSLVSEEIHRNIAAINDITLQSNEAFNEVWQAASNLMSMAENLEAQVSYFKLKPNQ